MVGVRLKVPSPYDSHVHHNQHEPILVLAPLPLSPSPLKNTFLAAWKISDAQPKACLPGGGGPQVGEVTRLGGVTRLSI